MLILLLSLLVSIAIVIVGLFSIKIKFIYFSGFLPGVFAYIFAYFYQERQRSDALLIQNQLKSIKAAQSQYPHDLGKITGANSDMIYLYGPYENFKEYEMEYFINGGLNKMYFDSKAGRWSKMGGSD